MPFEKRGPSAELTGPAAPAAEGAARSVALKWALGLAALVAFLLLARRAGGYVPAAAAWVDGLGSFGPIAFVVIYASAVVAFVPGSLLTLAGGAIFDLAEGTLYVFVAATIGSCLAFLVARYVARGAIERRLADNPKFDAVDRAVADQGFKIVLLLRLSPAFPFSLMNYALGLTRVRFRDYAAASIGMLPGTLLYVYYGKAAGDVAALAAGVEVDRGSGYYVVMALGLVATIAVTAVVTRLARRALAESTGASLGEAGE